MPSAKIPMPLSARHYSNSDNSARVWVTVFLVVIALFGAIVAWYQYYVTNRDVVGFLDRAQVAADIGRVDDYLAKLESGMNSYGMNTGHAAFIFKTPQNDVGSMYQVVEDLRQRRLPQAKEMDRSSPAYQTALDDIRGICRELEINSYAYKFRLRHDLAWLYIGGILYLLVSSIILIAMWGVNAGTMLEVLIIIILLFAAS